MTEATPAPAPDQAAQPTPDAKPDIAAEPTPDATDWKAEARKWETRAKENQKAARELEMARQASMTEAEKAVAEAEKRGRTAAATEFGTRLARTEWIAEAARRDPTFDAAAALEDLNLAKFVGEDGEPDTKAIAASVAKFVREREPAAPQPPSFDGGSRQPAASGPSMSQLIRQAAGRG